MTTIIVSAPGKLILHGEHAVVFGKKALAGSLGRRTTLTFQPKLDGFVSIHLPVVSIDMRWPVGDLLKLTAATDNCDVVKPMEVDESRLCQLRYFAQLSGTGDIAQIETRQLAILAFLHLYTSIAQSPIVAVESADIHVESSLPPSAGLGSSAAYSTCLAATLLVHRGLVSNNHKSFDENHTWAETELELVNQWAFIAEKIIHGRPSGIDNSVSTFGGALFFQSGKITPLTRMPKIRILLTNTKVERSTKLLVESVRNKHNKYEDIVKPVFESIEAITNRCQSALEQLYCCYCNNSTGDEISTLYSVLDDLVEMNQQLLTLLGVSHPSLEQIYEISRRHGLHAKLTGAGGGGCAFAIIPPNFSSDILEAVVLELTVAGFDSFETIIGGEGVSVKVIS